MLKLPLRAAAIFAALFLLPLAHSAAEEAPSLLEQEIAPYEAEFASLTFPELMKRQNFTYTAEVLEVEITDGEHKLPLPHYEEVYYDDGSCDYVLVDEPTEFWSYSCKAVTMGLSASFHSSFSGNIKNYVRPVLISSFVNSDTGEEIIVRRELPEVTAGDTVLVFDCSNYMKHSLPTYIIDAHGGAMYVPYRMGRWDSEGGVMID